MLVSIGGFVFWFGCSLLSFFPFFITFLFLIIFILITLFYLFIFLSFFLFLSTFSSEPCGWEGIGSPARCQVWASEVGELVQDIGPPETSRPHVISNGESWAIQTKSHTHTHSQKEKKINISLLPKSTASILGGFVVFSTDSGYIKLIVEI